MPRDPTLRKVAIIGSGPIMIGQAAEFDFSGSQASLAVREEGIEVVAINSNPATIQTDLSMADRVYVEPLEVDTVAQILERERPDGVLSGMGGQTALNICSELAERGVLDRLGIRLLGTPLDAIQKAEDRELFRQLMISLGEPVPKARAVQTLDDAVKVAVDVGYPCLVRPAFTLGGTGGGIAHNEAELREISARGLAYSRIHQVLVEESVLGWYEYEYEVMRDANDTCITICNMENLDPMGVHTGESVVVAPAQTLSDEEHQRLRSSALKIIRALGIVGGCNIQFAVHPETRDVRVIEVNPRVSRSSALASKATGYPIARVAAKLGIGFLLHEVLNRVTGTTPASFEPALDYVVLKIPRWPFDKFPHADRGLGTQMKSTGEVMAIGRTFEEAFLKAVRSTEAGVFVPSWPDATEDQLEAAMTTPTDQCILAVSEALGRDWPVEKVASLSRYNTWFLHKIREALRHTADAPTKRWSAARYRRRAYRMVDTCAGEFAARTPYYYGTTGEDDEVVRGDKPSVVVIGSGPIRIGQGIEFDYCCVHAARAIRELNLDAVMINNNPETVSTDFDTSNRLYFEPLTIDDVVSVLDREAAEGVMVQFGGQTSVNLALPLQQAIKELGLPTRVLGTTPEDMDVAEDREKFAHLLDTLRIPYPRAGVAHDLDEALQVASRIGYPALVRPSYVLGGRAMEVVYAPDDLQQYLEQAVKASPDHPVYLDEFLSHATEIDVDAASDGRDTMIGGIMEHVEMAGVHSGDSTCVMPPQSLPDDVLDTLRLYTRKISSALHVVGCLNVQYAIRDGEVHVLEANPRASRTMPYVAKATGIPVARVAARAMLGVPIKDQGVPLDPEPPVVSVKAPVFPFNKLPGLDPVLGPEMKSTGEVMGIAPDAPMAYWKAMRAAGVPLPLQGTVYLTVREEDKARVLPLAKALAQNGFKLVATQGTAAYLRGFEVPVETVWRISERQHPDAVDLMRRGDIQLIINTPTATRGARRDGYVMRRLAVDLGIPFLTTVEAARAAVAAIKQAQRGAVPPVCLSDVHRRK